MGEDATPQHEVPYLHVRAPRRVVGVGGEGYPVAKVYGNRAGLLALRELLARREQLDRALAAEEGLASQAAHHETDKRRLDLFVQRTYKRGRWGSPASPTGPTAPCSPEARRREG